MKLLLLLVGMAAIVISGCNDDEVTPPVVEPEEPQEPAIPAQTLLVNKFIHDDMDFFYLWREYMPDIDYTKEEDSEAYFDKLLYSELDHWSWITDDYEELMKSFSGIEKSFGYSLTFGRFSNTNNIFAIVEYVYPGTPAAEAGMKRGDLILELGGGPLTDDNFTDVLFEEDITITLGELTDEGSIATSSTTVSMTAEELTLDPVMIHDVIEIEDKKIGYLFYAQYIGKFNSSLNNVFGEFQVAGITDLVLDVRYNPGGGSDASTLLCSSIAPENVVSNEDILVQSQCNSIFKEFLDENFPDWLIRRFDKNVPVKLNLNHIYILATGNSASASELTITGLDPYMDVIHIGTNTHGKYTSSITIQPTDNSGKVIASIDNWALQPIVAKYANAQGVTDFVDGFTPDYEVEDVLLPAIPLGDPTEPLLAKAIELITGQPAKVHKAAKALSKHQLIGSRFSKFDRFKNNLIIENPMK